MVLRENWNFEEVAVNSFEDGVVEYGGDVLDGEGEEGEADLSGV